MRYLVKSTESEVWDVSAAEAIERGCIGTTTHWYGVQQTADGQWCVMIDDDAEIEGTTEVEPQWIANEERPSA